jgi:hypothetical protein
MATRLKSVELKKIATVAWLHGAIHSQARFTDFVTVTPELAAHLLANNPENRGINPKTVRQIQSAIEQGRWEVNGETVIVSVEGLLNDGQSRLKAIAQSGIPTETAFVYGVSRSSRYTVDQGRARSAAMMAKMMGLPNPDARAAIARLVMAYELSGGKSVTLANSFSANDQLRLAQEDGDVAVAAAFVDENRKHFQQYFSPAILGACYAILREIDAEDATDFIHQLAFGEQLNATDPAYMVRERALALGPLRRNQKVEAILRGWTIRRSGSPASRIRLTGGDLPKVQ